MNTRISKACLGFAFTLITSACFAQDDGSKVTTPPIFTADSLASGNAKDVLTSFFQLAFDQLTGKDKQLNFNSNPFALMLKSNPSLNVDTNYGKYRALRKFNFGVGLNLDSAYHFNGFSSGFKYALVNKRDTAASSLLHRAMDDDPLAHQRDSLHTLLTAFELTLAPDQRAKFHTALRQLLTKDIAFNQLDADLQAKVNQLVTADPKEFELIAQMIDQRPTSSFVREGKRVFDSLKNVVKQGLLWTVGVSDTTYKDQFFFSNIVVGTEIVKGIGAYHPGSNVEFDVKGALHLLDDSLAMGRDLKRSFLTFEPGFNWVIRNKQNDQSWLEFQLSGAYSHNFTTLYASEKRDSLTFNGTLRIRVYNDIWIPLSIKYDPRSGNFLGFINVRFNFSGQGGKSAAKKS
jgi:hypothetical protein